MSLDLSNTLVVGISATALFDLRTEDAEFQAEYAKNPENAVSEYRKLMEEKEDKELYAGTGFPLVRALLKLSK